MSASSLPEPAPRWSLATRIAFRFFFAFFVLYHFPFPFSVIPSLAQWFRNGEYKVLGAIFGITISNAPNGSGDKTIDWVRLGTIAVIALIATIVWSLADRKRESYTRLHCWFHIYIRFALAVAMITYGVYKVVPSQFVTPALDRMLEPIGDQSPMALLWNFMGASVPYTIFGGLGELIGGLLLTYRRTSLTGALISAAVMTQVVMLNFSYDVPVKIYSSMLLLTALVIIAPDAERLLRFFVPADRGPRIHLGWRVAIVLVIAYVTLARGYDAWKDRKEWDDAMVNPSPLAGIWNVDELTIDGVTHPPLMTDRARWRRLIIEGQELATMQNMDDSQTRFGLTLDEKKKSMKLLRRGSTMTLDYERPDAATLLVHGMQGGRKIAATLHKDTQRTFLLTTRGFHFINERPFSK